MQPGIKVNVDMKNFNHAVNGLKASMRSRKVLLDEIGKGLMLYTKETITTQGRGSWAPLAKSTKLATGRRKALLPIRDQIRFRSNLSAGTATVYFSGRPTGWSIQMHEEGFTSPAVKGPVMAASGLGVFNSRSESVIPPRRIFPTREESLKISGPIVDRWVERIIRMNWHD
jgi:hypothetical protein